MSEKKKRICSSVILLICLALPAYVHLRHIVESLFFPYDLTNALEGTFVAEADALARLEPLYTSPESGPVNYQAYPPTFPGAIRLLLPFFDAPILAGRWAGFLFMAFFSTLIAVFLHRENKEIGIAIAGALVPFVVFENFFAVAMHYHMYHAASFAAWISVLRYRQTRRVSWAILAALLAAGAGCARQTGLLAPIICFLLLADRHRRAGFWIATSALLMIASFHTSLIIASHGEYYRNCFAGIAVQPLRMNLLIDSAKYIAWHFLPLAIFVGAALFGSGGVTATEMLLILAGAPWILAGAITAGKVGSGTPHLWNGFYPIWIASLLILSRQFGFRRIILAALLGFTAWTHLEHPRRITARHWEDGRRLEALMQGSPGPVLVDRHLALAMPWHRAEYDVSRIFEAWFYEKHYPRQFIEDIKTRRYDLILTSRCYEPTEASEALDENYVETERIESGGEIFYRFSVMRRKPAR